MTKKKIKSFKIKACPECLKYQNHEIKIIRNDYCIEHKLSFNQPPKLIKELKNTRKRLLVERIISCFIYFFPLLGLVFAILIFPSFKGKVMIWVVIFFAIFLVFLFNLFYHIYFEKEYKKNIKEIKAQLKEWIVEYE